MKLLGSLLLLAVGCAAQLPEKFPEIYLSGGALNGRAWVAIPTQFKLPYVMGISDGWTAFGNKKDIVE